MHPSIPTSIKTTFHSHPVLIVRTQRIDTKSVDSEFACALPHLTQVDISRCFLEAAALIANECELRGR